jgi:type IV pilus assembly protein PilO
LKQKLLIALSIILAGVGYASYEFFFVFQGQEFPILDAAYKKVESDVEAKKNELKQLQEFSKNIEQVQKELKELQAKLDSALEYMPRTFKLEGLLRKLTLLAANSGVELSTFRPKKGEEKGSSFYSTIAIDFDMKGSFTQTLVFLDQLTRLKRIVNIDSLKLRPMDAAANATRSGATIVVTQASIKTFRFSE